MKSVITLLFVMVFGFSYDCLATGHDAYAHFKFCNSLKERTVILRPEKTEEAHDKSIEGFEEFTETEVLPQQRIFFKEELKNYQEIVVGEHASPMLVIGVYVGYTRVGSIKLMKTLCPDPSFVYETEKNNLGLELRIQRPRFGGGPRTIEIAPRSRLQR